MLCRNGKLTPGVTKNASLSTYSALLFPEIKSSYCFLAWLYLYWALVSTFPSCVELNAALVFTKLVAIYLKSLAIFFTTAEWFVSILALISFPIAASIISDWDILGISALRKESIALIVSFNPSLII